MDPDWQTKPAKGTYQASTQISALFGFERMKRRQHAQCADLRRQLDWMVATLDDNEQS